jgi:hypothetical protein
LRGAGEVVKVAHVVLGLRMYVFCIITAFRVALGGAAVQPNMTSNGGPAEPLGNSGVSGGPPSVS